MAAIITKTKYTIITKLHLLSIFLLIWLEEVLEIYIYTENYHFFFPHTENYHIT